MIANQTSPVSKECGVRITQVRIANFRSLENIEVDLDDLTVLVGANNSGKTSFLDALYAAIGAGRRVLAKEDIHLKNGETHVPGERKAVIDIRIEPCCDDHGKFLEAFPTGSFWTRLWGESITPDSKNEFVGIRTVLAWNSTHNEYRLERKFLKQWKNFSEWHSADTQTAVTSRHLEPIALYYMDAQRDIEEDLHSAGSFWRRLVSDLGLPEATVAEFEKTLTNLNAELVANSPVLRHLHEHLVSMDNIVHAERDDIDITPVTRHLRDLTKGMDIHFATSGAQSFPLAKHGMGTRSLASILVFRAYASWRELQAKKHHGRIHTFLALEEPEAHLHPQAQRSLFRQIKEIPGQRILSTHSPYFAGQARLEELRLFQKIDNDSRVSRLDTSSLSTDNRRKLEQQIFQTRGDILFCRALILCEGQTEELALPIYAQAYWGKSVHELGFNFVYVGGMDYYPLIWLAKGLGIKWYIFSDGEEAIIKRINTQLEQAKQGNAPACDNVVVIPDGNNMEKYLIAQRYLPEVEEAINKTLSRDLDKYIQELDGKERKKGKPKNRDYNEEGRGAAAIDAMNENKTALAMPIAYAITATADPTRRVPELIKQLFDKISSDSGIEKAGGVP